jgi:uncharacterized protein with von Willebrand factor type A (vWA) domain
MGEREQVRGAGAAVFVRRRDDREVYDRVFDRFWRRRGAPGFDRADGPSRAATTTTRRPTTEGADAEPATNRGRGRRRLRGGIAGPGRSTTRTTQSPTIDGVIAAPDAYSAARCCGTATSTG